MKKLLSFAVAFMLVLGYSFAQTTPATIQPATTDVINSDGPVMELESTEVDYGEIEQESDPYRLFAFTNTGNAPLIIKHAKGSCGCTVPTYPKEPIMPGESGEIKVRYDTKRLGKFTKTVTLTTNENIEKRVLRIKGDVKPAAPEPEGVPTNTANPFNSGK